MKKIIFFLMLIAELYASVSIAKPGKLFVVYGPSGAGKTTLIREVVQKLTPELSLTRVITYTTRTPRPGEREGLDYHFVSLNQFNEKKNNQFFIHTDELFSACYGLQRSIVLELEMGKNFIVSLDRRGAQEISALITNSVLLWIEAPINELMDRMLKRNGDTENQISKRCALAKQEITLERDNGIYDYRIFNDDLDAALTYMMQVIKTELMKDH